MSNWLLFVFAAVFLVLIPLAPKLLRLRIRFLRWIHWEWAARLNEDHSRVGVGSCVWFSSLSPPRCSMSDGPGETTRQNVPSVASPKHV